MDLLYEGKAKKIYKTDMDEAYLVEYKDDATAFNGKKKGTILLKGEMNNKISSILFQLLQEHGIPNHFIKRISDREQLVKEVKIIPLEVVVRNIVAGTLTKRIGLNEGTELKQPIIEFYYKNDELNDPLINKYHISVLNLASESQLEIMEDVSLKVNKILMDYLGSKGLILVDFKLEFGISNEGTVILADEISPDTCRFWDKETNKKLDKDRFRQELGNVEEAYQEILNRLGGE